MGVKLTNCKVCNAEMPKNVKVCPSCGVKNKKPLYQKWWVWTIVVLFMIIAVSSGGN